MNTTQENLAPNLVTKGTMKKGSVLIYFGSLFHSGGQDITDRRQCGAVISYSLGWLRQTENNYLAYSRDELLDMPECLQKLLGYFVHEPNLGSVNGIDRYELCHQEQAQPDLHRVHFQAAKMLVKEAMDKVEQLLPARSGSRPRLRRDLPETGPLCILRLRNGSR